jgi:hypothetical protein
VDVHTPLQMQLFVNHRRTRRASFIGWLDVHCSINSSASLCLNTYVLSLIYATWCRCAHDRTDWNPENAWLKVYSADCLKKAHLLIGDMTGMLSIRTPLWIRPAPRAIAPWSGPRHGTRIHLWHRDSGIDYMKPISTKEETHWSGLMTRRGYQMIGTVYSKFKSMSFLSLSIMSKILIIEWLFSWNNLFSLMWLAMRPFAFPIFWRWFEVSPLGLKYLETCLAIIVQISPAIWICQFAKT